MPLWPVMRNAVDRNVFPLLGAAAPPPAPLLLAATVPANQISQTELRARDTAFNHGIGLRSVCSRVKLTGEDEGKAKC